MRVLAAAVLVGAALFSAPAHARYGFCDVDVDGTRYMSGILDFGADKEHYLAAKQGFADAYGRKAECVGVHSTAAEAESFKRLTIDVNKFTVSETGWVGSYGAAGTAKPPSAGGAFISVKESGRQAEIDAWENSVLQMHRQSAAIRAQIIANSAAAKAESARLMAKVKAEMKKRGNKQ